MKLVFTTITEEELDKVFTNASKYDELYSALMALEPNAGVKIEVNDKKEVNSIQNAIRIRVDKEPTLVGFKYKTIRDDKEQIKAMYIKRISLLPTTT